jgi:hypothetical protein
MIEISAACDLQRKTPKENNGSSSWTAIVISLSLATGQALSAVFLVAYYEDDM